MRRPQTRMGAWEKEKLKECGYNSELEWPRIGRAAW